VADAVIETQLLKQPLAVEKHILVEYESRLAIDRQTITDLAANLRVFCR
jgi:hypothetical protein